MVETTVEVKLKTGLQARQAALFVQEANRYKSEVYLQKEEKKVNAKSIMGIMSLAIARGTAVTLIADGKDESEAIKGLATLIEKEE
ncbi:HPr family phosphocarrier protein [Lysinibacillus endophyticus]|uniref:HPr family phosphocarrier protein n=1 Tax=Ureibacillus endophyticus TaxID=1978490 RepID=A0A494Z2K7_9BACL|nr:HPr family phosphocarrier protein [Lysinibacillus endophyticus]MCP1145822.1 HPr family phosphocarrier protein [Lysinibacillus endophyticus]RKQ16720.1 HPr family phosphocarrier protein [Lysinibacillus endophyticus]